MGTGLTGFLKSTRSSVSLRFAAINRQTLHPSIHSNHSQQIPGCGRIFQFDAPAIFSSHRPEGPFQRVTMAAVRSIPQIRNRSPSAVARCPIHTVRNPRAPAGFSSKKERSTSGFSAGGHCWELSSAPSWPWVDWCQAPATRRTTRRKPSFRMDMSLVKLLVVLKHLDEVQAFHLRSYCGFWATTRVSFSVSKR